MHKVNISKEVILKCKQENILIKDILNVKISSIVMTMAQTRVQRFLLYTFLSTLTMYEF